MFDIKKLTDYPGRLRDKLKKFHLSPFVIFIILGIVSTIWFLIRVVPKPSRASYPCMRAAAPFMSGFILYLMSVWGTVLITRKFNLKKLNTRYISTFFLVFGVIVAMAVSPAQHLTLQEQENAAKSGPEDGPNQPIGKGTGVNPGRVVWAWDPEATNENAINAFYLYKPENTNQEVVSRMVSNGIKKLNGTDDLKKAWDAMFKSFNSRKNKTKKGYTQGEKIFIKINQGTANAKIRPPDYDNGFNVSRKMSDSERAQKGLDGTCETYPNVVMEILRELVNVAGVDQKNISIGDPISHVYGFNSEMWLKEFPNIVIVDRASDKAGRKIIYPTADTLIFYSDGTKADKLYDVIEEADYMINIASLKPHGRAGISLTAKNHFGSHGRQSAFHLHYSLISPVSLGKPTNNGYKKYRVMVDLMGSRYLGQNTLLYVIDGLYAGGSNETKVPVKYFMPPFNNDWCNSVFLSQDQVALESVCYDFLRTEWNGAYSHNPANNAYESIPNVYGVDDYLHQAADRSTWPKGIIYDPDKSGTPLTSLGIHEHWNDPATKQYSRNLGKKYGIELVSIPDTLVRNEKR